MKQIPITEATDQQLRDFARRSLQLEIHHNLGRDKVLAAMQPVHNSDTISVEDDAPAIPLGQNQSPATGPQKRLKGGRADSDPKVEVTIGNGASQVDGSKDVFVSVNGRYWVIQRNVRVEIPYRVYLALSASRRGESMPGPDDEHAPAAIITDVTNYPMTIHRFPTREEIEAFHAATRDIEIA